MVMMTKRIIIVQILLVQPFLERSTPKRDISLSASAGQYHVLSIVARQAEQEVIQQPHSRWQSPNPLVAEAPFSDTELRELRFAAGRADTGGTLERKRETKKRTSKPLFWDSSTRVRPQKSAVSKSPLQLIAEVCFRKVIPRDSMSYNQGYQLHLYLQVQTECSSRRSFW